MFAKLKITGMIELRTGMHIGGSSQFAAIGAVDSPIFRDAVTGLPMIPGSSLKGKMRSLLSTQYNDGRLSPDFNDDDERILRLFGSTGKDDVRAGRLLFYDMILSNKAELEKAGVSETEVKFENSIQRLTAVANPRQIERAVRGSKFQMDLIYTMDAKVTQEILLEDFETIRDGFRLLTFDYLGGNGSRGYGRVKFDNLATECVVGNLEDSVMNKLNSILKG